MQRDHPLALIHSSAPDTAQLLHVGTNTEQQSQMHTQSSDVCTSLTAHPEHAQLPFIIELVELALMDRSDTQLTLDGGNQGRSLEQGSSKGLKGARKLRLTAWNLVMKSDNTDVFFSGTLLRLDETGSAVDTDNETASDFGVEGSAVAGLLNPITQSVHAQGNRSNGIYLKILLIHATTSWLEGFEGLSRLMTPELM